MKMCPNNDATFKYEKKKKITEVKNFGSNAFSIETHDVHFIPCSEWIDYVKENRYVTGRYFASQTQG